MQTFRETESEVKFFRSQQISKYTHIYSITFNITYPSSQIVTFQDTVLQVMEDADFHCTHLSGSIVGPIVNSVRNNPGGTGGALNFPMAGAGERQDRGVSFRFFEQITNRELDRGNVTRNQVDLTAQSTIPWDHKYVDFGNVFGPGYGMKWGKTLPYKYFMPRGHRLKISFQCQERSGYFSSSGSSLVSMAFIGNRYQ